MLVLPYFIKINNSNLFMEPCTKRLQELALGCTNQSCGTLPWQSNRAGDVPHLVKTQPRIHDRHNQRCVSPPAGGRGVDEWNSPKARRMLWGRSCPCDSPCVEIRGIRPHKTRDGTIKPLTRDQLLHYDSGPPFFSLLIPSPPPLPSLPPLLHTQANTQTNKQTHTHTHTHTHKTNKQTNKNTHTHTNKQTHTHTHKQKKTHKQTNQTKTLTQKMGCIAARSSQSDCVRFCSYTDMPFEAGKPPRSPHDWLCRFFVTSSGNPYPQQWLPQRMPHVSSREG